MMEEAQNRNLTLERLLDAPLERVWKAWTDQKAIQAWWGPRGVTNPTCVWEPVTGGKIDVVMLAGPELGELAGQEWPMTGEFKEVVPQQKLVFFSQPLMNGKPVMDTENTVTFEPQGDKTKLRVAVKVSNITPEATDALAGQEVGWNQTVDKLTEYVRA